MPAPALLPAGEPLGFPKCPKCPYRYAGPARVCFACAAKTLEAITPPACPVCSQRLEPETSCRNWLCQDPGRRIERIDAISYHTGYLQAKINSYKYDGKAGWSLIFGRLLVGWLDAHASTSPPGLIVANPTYVEPTLAGPGHIETIIRAAATADYERRWAFDTLTPAAIIKTMSTDKSAGHSAAAKRSAAAALRRILAIPDPARTRGRDILIFDDVCTTGSQLNAVADCLLDDGHATRVRALVLARAPWRPR
jgi:predicted amidophosphoribosyltransferase